MEFIYFVSCCSKNADYVNFPKKCDFAIISWGMVLCNFPRFFPAPMSTASSSVPSSSRTGRPGVRHSSEPRKRFLASGSSDEDPYSLTPSGSSGSSGKGRNSENTPRLPPREKEYFGPQNWAKVRASDCQKTIQFLTHITCPLEQSWNCYINP